MIKKEKGITLIALIVTIVVLLILAGISIGAIVRNNSIVDTASDSKIYTELSRVQNAIDLYKVHREQEVDDVDTNTLINDKLLKEYTVEQTYRPIAVIEGLKTLDIDDGFGKGYKDIEESMSGYIGSLEELKNVYAVDMVDGSLYYINNGKVWNLEGKTEIAKDYGRVDADTSEWTFNSSTQALTAYNWGSRIGEQRGNQAPGEIVIPNYYNGIRVKSIAARLFRNNKNITKLTISTGIQTIGDNAFYGCSSLKGDLILPKSLASIGNEAFRGCGGLTGDLILPNSLTTLGTHVFFECTGLTGKLEISNNLISIGGSAFYRCVGLRGNLTIPDSVTTIGDYAFYGCSGLTGDLTIPKGVTSIGNYTFYGCTGLTGDLIVPSNVASVGNNAFNGCKGFTGDLIIQNGVITIGDRAFYGCSELKGNLTISNTTTSIGNEAFRGCSGLTGDLVIPDSVTSIGNQVFFECSSLTGGLVIPTGITSIGGSLFLGCSGLTGDVTIPDNITSIGTYAFDGCIGLTEVRIPKSVETIGTNAFRNLAKGSTIYLQDESLLDLIAGKYSAARTTVVVDPSKFDE